MVAQPRRRIYRSSRDRILLGVAGGLAEAAGIDPFLVRTVFGAITLLGGAGVVVYLMLAAWLPVREDERRPGDPGPCLDETATIMVVGGLAGLVLVGAGLVTLAVQFGWRDQLALTVPWIVMGAVVLAGMVLSRWRQQG